MVTNITVEDGPSVVESQVIKMHEDTELDGVWWGWGWSRTSRHIASHSVGAVQLLQDEQSEQSRFGSPQGQRFVVNAAQIGAGPSYSVRTWGSPRGGMASGS